jgi:hypothetical protein
MWVIVVGRAAAHLWRMVWAEGQIWRVMGSSYKAQQERAIAFPAEQRGPMLFIGSQCSKRAEWAATRQEHADARVVVQNRGLGAVELRRRGRGCLQETAQGLSVGERWCNDILINKHDIYAR